jgi:hypothetical protein
VEATNVSATPTGASADRFYLVAVQDGTVRRPFIRLRRAVTGIYVLDLRASEKTPRSIAWNPHTTYHSDGSFGLKSYETALLSGCRQPLSSAFTGTETMGMCPIYLDQVRTISDPWTREPPYAGVFEIPADLLSVQLSTCRTYLAVDLAAPGSPAFDAMAGAGRIISNRTFTDQVPHILVSLWEG